jgi:hypothetical protein
MPSIKDSTNPDLSGYTPVAATPTPTPAPANTEQPGKNVYLRCPLPVLYENNPDALRQWPNSQVPQSRLLTPLAPVANAGNISETNNVLVQGGGSGGGSSTVNISPNANNTFNDTYLTTVYSTQVVVTTPQVTPGSSYTGITIMSQSFQLLGFAASSACRVRLYSTAQSQNADLARGLDDPCPAGIVQGLICDVAMDTTPLSWQFADRLGSNGDSPATGNIYCTIENLTNATNAITLTIQYVPLSQGTSPTAPTVSVGNTTISNSMLATWNGVAMLSGAQFTGPIESYNVISGQISAVNIDATGSTTVTDLTASGNITTVDLTITGSLALTNISANDITAVNITSTSSVTANDITASGNISAVDLTATGSVVTNTLSASGTITVNEVITGAVNSPIVNVNAGAGGLQVNGTQISSTALSDASNIPTLSGANVFTQPLTAASITTTNGGSVSVFAGEVKSASITTTNGSSTSVFAGEVQSAQFTQSGSSSNTFNGPVNVVDIVSTGGTTLVTINGFLPPTESSANKTLNHVLIQSASVGTLATFTAAELVSTGISFSVTSAGTSDVFDIDAQMLYKIVSTGGTNANGAFLVCLVDGVIGSQFGFGLDNVFSGLGPSVCNFRGNTTGLTAGAHTITLYYCAMILTGGSTPGPLAPAGFVTFVNATGSSQQISG